jgi:DNA polymerase I-like protein with 3'-5' exonuclease and polymerase domains
MLYTIFDIETDGLLKDVSKIHCLSYRKYNSKTLIDSDTLTDYNDIIDFITNQEILVGHNIIKYDIPVLEKLLEININCQVIDTLGISYYHYPVKDFKHGLGAWGERLGFGKPIVEDWKDQDISVYINRCESDVEINTRLFHSQMDYTMQIYDNNINMVRNIFNYLNFKLICLRDQENFGIDLDVDLVLKSMQDLEIIIDNKIKSLSENMPKHLGKILHTMPKNLHKKDETLSAHGVKWLEKLKEFNLPFETTEIREEPNPGSPSQLKEWLFSLGWQPITFKLSKNTGEEVPQVSLPFGQGLCSSVKDMFENYPYLEDLDGLYKAQHRYGVFKSFIENKDENNKIYSEAHGFTNTLRLQHSKPIANLPGVDKWYGKEIRSCLTINDPKYSMCGSDISGLEDNTKQHYIYFFDPDYVNDMRVPGFDPHIDIGLLAGLITQEEADLFKFIESLSDQEKKDIEEGKARIYKIVKKKRSTAKQVNFACVYGAGPPKIAETAKISLVEAKLLHSVYWKRNKAVKQIANSCIVKTVNGQKWLLNPISGFWLFLKAEKDRFSTLNQNSGVYVFDSWLRKVKEKIKNLDIHVVLQYHDEILLVYSIEFKDKLRQILEQAMVETNEQLKLNIEIGISVDFGNNYGECH